MAYIPSNGSVVAFQGNPSVLQVLATVTNPQSVSGTVGASVIGLTPIQIPGSVAVAIVSGSIAASFTPPANQSVSGTVGASIIGLPPVNVTNFPTNPSISGTVQVGNFPTNQNVSGSVVAFVNGTVPVNAAGSVVAFQGAGWSGSVAAIITGTPNVNTAGSVVAFQGTNPWVIQSIVGTYAEDAASAGGDKGILSFGVRNDTIASLTSADLDYGTHTIDSAGRSVIKPFAPEDGTIISYVGSVVSASVTLIQASAIGKRSYMTDFWVTNTGSVAQLVTFQGGDTSIVGFTIAPAGGGSNSPGIAIPLKTNASQDLAFKVTGTSSVVYLTVKGYQAP